jgi:hypothetical protein
MKVTQCQASCIVRFIPHDPLCFVSITLPSPWRFSPTPCVCKVAIFLIFPFPHSIQGPVSLCIQQLVEGLTNLCARETTRTRDGGQNITPHPLLYMGRRSNFIFLQIESSCRAMQTPLASVTFKIGILWGVTPCSLLTWVPNYTASHHRRLYYLYRCENIVKTVTFIWSISKCGSRKVSIVSLVKLSM